MDSYMKFGQMIFILFVLLVIIAFLQIPGMTDAIITLLREFGISL